MRVSYTGIDRGSEFLMLCACFPMSGSCCRIDGLLSGSTSTFVVPGLVAGTRGFWGSSRQ